MKISIIIADDHQLFIDGIKSILANEINIEIIGEVNNGLELINSIESGCCPNVVITDIRMPVLDGITATRLLQKTHPHIHILALSMYDQSADVIEMLDAGAKGYVTKNVEKEELVKALHTIVKNQYFFSKNLPKDIQEWFQKERSEKEIVLTRREQEILQLLVKGRTSNQMAKALKISKYTIDTHRKNIHKKLGIKSNTGLVNYVLKNMNS